MTTRFVPRVCKRCGHKSTASYYIPALKRSLYLCVRCAPIVMRESAKPSPGKRT